MPFRNDILGGEDLVRSGMRSQNYSDGSESLVEGWRIGRDGSAVFNNVTVGSSDWTISSTGDAVFHQVSADEIVLDGESLADKFDALGSGILSVYELTGTSAARNGGPAQWADLRIDNVQERTYRVSLLNVRIDVQSTSPLRVQLEGWYAFDKAATDSDNRFLFWQHGARNTSSTSDDQPYVSSIINVGSADVGKEMSIALFVDASIDGPRIGQLANPSYVIIEDLGFARNVQALDVSSVGSSTQQYTKWYECVWAGSWDVSDGKISGNNFIYQGDYSGSNNRYGKFGFLFNTIQNDLSGATIDDVKLRMTNNHTWYNDGWTVSQARIGTHWHGSEPTGSSSTNGNFDRFQFSWDKGQTKYVQLPDSIGEEFRDGLITGFTMGRPNAGTQGEYGYMEGSDGSASSDLPILRITYTK